MLHELSIHEMCVLILGMEAFIRNAYFPYLQRIVKITNPFFTITFGVRVSAAALTLTQSGSCEDSCGTTNLREFRRNER